MSRTANPISTAMFETAAGDSQAGVTTDLSQQSVNQLAARAQSGCDVAFTVLADRLRPRLISFLHHRLRNLEDAEDIAQDSLSRAWQQLEQFDARFQFTTWLYVIAKRRAADHTRRQRSITATHSAIDLQAVAAQPERSVDDESTNIWAVAARCLSACQYSALWLRYGEGLPVKEVAQVLGKTNVGVRVQLHRARTTIKRTMTERDYETVSGIANSYSTARGDQ